MRSLALVTVLLFASGCMGLIIDPGGWDGDHPPDGGEPSKELAHV